MKEITREWIDYTNSRKLNTKLAIEKESIAKPVSISKIRKSSKLKFPKYHKPSLQYTTINYQVEKEKLGRVKFSLGDSWMSNKDAGIKTYEYYRKNGMEKQAWQAEILLITRSGQIKIQKEN